jgi:hypothetical protein
MKRILALISTIFFLTNSYSAESADALNGAVGITRLISDSPNEYIAQLKQNVEVFEDLGSIVAGVCIALSGNEVAGEMQMFNYSPSISIAFKSWGSNLTNRSTQRLRQELNQIRTLTGERTYRVVKPYAGPLRETWAIRVLELNTENLVAYVNAASNLEAAYKANGFEDFDLEINQAIVAGSVSAYSVTAVAPTLERLGAAFDALYSESWAQEAYSLVTSSRSSVVTDKLYTCEQIYQAM